MAGEPFEPTGDLPKSARLSFYTPLLPYFLALMFACIIAGTFQWRVYSDIFLTLGTASVLLEITLRFFTSIFSDKEDKSSGKIFGFLRGITFATNSFLLSL